MGFQFDLSFLIFEIGVAIKYIPVVLLLSIVPLIIGLLLGTGIAIIRLFKIRPFDKLFTVFVIFLRGVPLVLQLTILYLAVSLSFDSLARTFGLQMSSKDLSYTLIAVVGLSINATVYLSEVMRTALQSVPAGQHEAAYSVGMTSGQMLRRIIIPQSLPVAIPLIGSNFIGLIKGSAIASLISVVEIINATLYEASGNYKFLEAYVAAAIIYWLLCILVERLVAFLECRVGVYGKGGVV
ncbi:amino acid ABC transporter permease [Sporomusa sp.]|uniref:amino acid ABC transporter permease n=1 Tax=Sporomusa sp. TaxID=2078658 RepID=UPI002C4B17B1|nr:amino acid ABC transporter permease [Sporomusa sp.]HWR43911.1 amino acid ABC transporter permease [Sporomusa sp.]